MGKQTSHQLVEDLRIVPDFNPPNIVILDISVKKTHIIYIYIYRYPYTISNVFFKWQVYSRVMNRAESTSSARNGKSQVSTPQSDIERTSPSCQRNS